MAILKNRNKNLPAHRHQNQWNPLREISELQNNIDRMWNEFETMDEPFVFTPPVDVHETDNAFLLSFDLPGIPKNDVKIELRDNQLVVSGERKMETEHHEHAGCLTNERFRGAFIRSFTLPTTVDPAKVEASFRDGVLHIALPKTEATKAKPIEIKEAGKANFIDKLLGHDKKKDEKAA